jgi:hypothetical protein
VNAVVAIAQAQFRQQWKLVLLPLGGGLIAATIQALGKAGPRPGVTQIVGILVALTLTPTVAVLLGLNLLAPELRQRRLSFYLSRPCAPWKLWAGRLAAALAILVVSLMGAVPALPILMEGPGMNPWSTTAGVAVLSLTLLLVINASASVLLSFAWDALVVDLVAVGLVVASASALYRSLLDLFAEPDPFLVFPAMFCFAVVALVPAGLAFLRGGRGRPRWGHRWFSWTFWPLVLLSVAGLHVGRIVEVNTPLSSVLRTDGSVQPLDAGGFAIQLWGKKSWDVRGFERRSKSRLFVVDVQTGLATRVSGWLAGRVLSSDGEYSAWHQFSGALSRDSDLLVARTSNLDQPLYRGNAPCCLADVSEGGEHVLLRGDTGLQVLDVPSGTLGPEIPLTEMPSYSTARFVDARSLEATVWEKSAFRRVTFDLSGNILSDWRTPRPPAASLLFQDETGRYAITQKSGITLYDRDGKVVDTLQGLSRLGYFTRNGAFVVTIGDALTIIPADGSAHRTVTITTKPASSPKETELQGFRVWVSGQLDTGELVVRIIEGGQVRSILVDPETAAIRLSLDGIQPLYRRWREKRSPALDTVLRVFQNEDGDLLYLDPGATKLRLLVKSTAGDF